MLCLLVILGAPVALAQVGSATLIGTITDDAGEALPGVTLTVTSPDTNVARSITTTGHGAYVVSGLPPGPY